MIRNIVLIGAGKLATQLGSSLSNKGFNIRQVYSRTAENAEALADKLNAYWCNDLSEMQQDADMYIVSVSDSALSSVIENMPSVKGIVVHTAGSLSMDMLIKFDRYGIFYPFQTFSKEREVNFYEIPLLLEANDDKVMDDLMVFAKNVSKTVLQSDSNQRQKIHLAAVFACNFSNHMYAIADEILSENNIDFDVIRPLIKETAEKTEVLSPVKAQTGPAVRGDQNVIDKHLKLLANDKELAGLYKKLSQRIMDLSMNHKTESEE
ncbi:DUF2520 domain-containing protein [Labilibacter sediminis]|nr:DUF2520 domain-containing protein [Labilibacter sediminis]